MEKTPIKTYLPVWPDMSVLNALQWGDYQAVAEALSGASTFERAGVDRLLLILSDLTELGLKSPRRVLDIGCNSGLFSLGLGLLGYDVTGIDDNVAALSQGWYPEPPLSLAERGLRQLQLTERVRFETVDATVFVDQPQAAFDVCLLLSVVHQWFEGYASTPLGAKPLTEIERTLRRISALTRNVLYFEGPEHETDALKQTLPLPDWFVAAGLFREVTVLGTSATALGDLRTIYRLS